MDFWSEYPPVFLMVRSLSGVKDGGGSNSPRKPKRERSDEYEKAMFVKEWGGRVMHPDSLPLAVQGAIADAIAGLNKN